MDHSKYDYLKIFKDSWSSLAYCHYQLYEFRKLICNRTSQLIIISGPHFFYSIFTSHPVPLKLSDEFPEQAMGR